MTKSKNLPIYSVIHEELQFLRHEKNDDAVIYMATGPTGGPFGEQQQIMVLSGDQEKLIIALRKALRKSKKFYYAVVEALIGIKEEEEKVPINDIAGFADFLKAFTEAHMPEEEQADKKFQDAVEATMERLSKRILQTRNENK